ncbi:MAG: LysR family transcriptional regulator, partial [Paracoccaceae bacterium]|nr:LysR family transcriptional regulator [Paracoccaceae bacterium]
MPLSRSHVLPKALAAFRQERPRMAVRVLDGPYDELLAGLRRGEIDILIGALRDPLPIDDVVQERLFDDTLTILAGAGHPLLDRPAPTPADLAEWPWLVARRGTPTRRQFDLLFTAADVSSPHSIIETGSVILMREMVQDDRHLACVSRLQAAREIARGLVQVLPVDMGRSARPIGLTMREGWTPTPAQGALLEKIRAVGG